MNGHKICNSICHKVKFRDMELRLSWMAPATSTELNREIELRAATPFIIPHSLDIRKEDKAHYGLEV